jgi:hypothetical protein
MSNDKAQMPNEALRRSGFVIWILTFELCGGGDMNSATTPLGPSGDFVNSIYKSAGWLL